MPICAAPGEATLSSYRKNAVAASNANEQAPQRRRVARHRVCMRAFLRFTPLRPAHPGAKNKRGDSGISLKRKSPAGPFATAVFHFANCPTPRVLAYRAAFWPPPRRGAGARLLQARPRAPGSTGPCPCAKQNSPQSLQPSPEGSFLWFFMISYASNPLGLFFCQRQLSSHISSKLRTAFHPSSW